MAAKTIVLRKDGMKNILVATNTSVEKDTVIETNTSVEKDIVIEKEPIQLRKKSQETLNTKT